jgi:hypothetical protein
MLEFADSPTSVLSDRLIEPKKALVNGNRSAVNKEQILREIQRTADANDGKPLGRLRFLSETGIKESDWRGRYWARWNDALREAGYGPNKLQEGYEDAELLKRLAQLVRELGRVPVVSEMQLKSRSDPSFPNSKTFERFGSKQQLLARLLVHVQAHAKDQDLIPIIAAAVTPAIGDDVLDKTRETELGFVYLLKSGRHSKIGRSNAAGRRERELAIQLPEKASMIHVIRTDDPAGIEAYWHHRFADRRKNGEWFELSAADIATFKRRKFM